MAVTLTATIFAKQPVCVIQLAQLWGGQAREPLWRGLDGGPAEDSSFIAEVLQQRESGGEDCAAHRTWRCPVAVDDSILALRAPFAVMPAPVEGELLIG